MSLVVTASAGGNASPGIQLAVVVLDNAALAVTPVTASSSAAGVQDIALTPAATGSLVYAATVAGVATVTPATGQTTLASLTDATNTLGYWAGYHTATTTGGTPVTVGVTNNAAGGVAACEVQKTTAAIATDASTPAAVSTTTGTVISTAAFTPPAGTLLLAFASAGGSLYGAVSMTVSDSYGLVWTELVAADAAGNFYAGIWYAQAPPALSLPASQATPAGYVGSVYSGALNALGGFAPYTWALATGSLPAGLALASTGAITGTPTTAGTGTFTATATDATGAAITTGSLSIVVNAALTAATPSVVQVWRSTGNPYEYGTTKVNVANNSGNWLAVVVSWTATQDGTAVSFVADDARNFYREVVLEGDQARTQVWICPMAQAAGKVYVSQSAFVRSIRITVIEIANLAGYILNTSAANYSNSASSLNLSMTVSLPSFCLAVGASKGTQLLSLDGSWTVLGQSTVDVVGWHNTVFNNSTVPATFTDSVSPYPFPPNVPISGAILAFQEGASPVYSSPANPAWPQVYVRAAFGYTPGAPTTTPTWTDISSRFLGFSGERGRNFELDELAAADLSLMLDNFDGALSPQNSSSPYLPTLVTPVQVLADWQGRRYCIFRGVITALPQTFEFQRGMVEVALSDDYSKLPQVLLPSAMVSEVLYDRPLHLWPLNDQVGTNQASNWSGRSANILVPVKGKYGGGLGGNTPNTGFGNSSSGNYPAGLEGTQDTVWGNYTGQIGGSISGYVQGTALCNRNDSSLPLTATGATYEFWALVVNDLANLYGGAIPFILADEKGTNGGGDFLRVVLYNIGTVGSPQTIFAVYGAQVSYLSMQRINSPNVFDSGWHHYAFTITTAGYVSVFLDGVNLGSFNASFPSGTPNRLMLGGDVTVNPYWSSSPFTSTSTGGGFFTGMMCNAAVYDRVLDTERIQAHYNSGANGFVTELSGTRIQRVLTWAGWAGPQAIEPGISHMQIFNYLNSGYGSSGLSGAVGQYATAGGGAAYQGAQADITVQDIASSECGFLFVAADGTLTFRQRDALYNQPVKAIMGDQDYALNKVVKFGGGLGPWASNLTSCTITTAGTWSYSSAVSAVMTVTGSPSQASARSEFLPAVQAGASMWVMAPTGCYAQAWLGWYGVSGYISASAGPVTWCPPMVPVQLSVPVSAPPGGALTMWFGPNIVSNPATGTQLYFDRPRISAGSFQVNYDEGIEVNEDIQYLYNDVIITRNIDQATYRARDQASRAAYYPRVYLRTIYTDEADPQAVVDVAHWLLNAYSQPGLRVTRVTVKPAANPDLWPFVLGTDIGDLVEFIRTPLGGAPVSGVFMVLSITVDLGQDKAEWTYVLAPGAGDSILTLDDPVYGLIGSTNDLGW